MINYYDLPLSVINGSEENLGCSEAEKIFFNHYDGHLEIFFIVPSSYEKLNSKELLSNSNTYAKGVDDLSKHSTKTLRILTYEEIEDFKTLFLMFFIDAYSYPTFSLSEQGDIYNKQCRYRRRRTFRDFFLLLKKYCPALVEDRGVEGIWSMFKDIIQFMWDMSYQHTRPVKSRREKEGKLKKFLAKLYTENNESWNKATNLKLSPTAVKTLNMEPAEAHAYYFLKNGQDYAVYSFCAAADGFTLRGGAIHILTEYYFDNKENNFTLNKYN